MYSFKSGRKPRSSNAQQPPPAVAVLGDGEDAELLRRVARALVRRPERVWGGVTADSLCTTERSFLDPWLTQTSL